MCVCGYGGDGRELGVYADMVNYVCLCMRIWSWIFVCMGIRSVIEDNCVRVCMQIQSMYWCHYCWPSIASLTTSKCSHSLLSFPSAPQLVDTIKIWTRLKDGCNGRLDLIIPVVKVF